MTRLDRISARIQGRLISKADLLYPHPLTFTLGNDTWDVHCGVQDPQELKRDAVAAAEAAARDFQVAYRDLRLLDILPGERRPPIGATAPWDTGTLEVLHWGQENDFTKQKLGTCVLRR